MSLSTNLPSASSDPGAILSGPLTAEQRIAAAETAKLVRVGADWRPADELVQRIVAMTQTLFPGEVTTEIDCDPSEPDDPWICFSVISDLPYTQAKPLRSRWHDEVRDLGVSDVSRYRLGIWRT